MQVETDIYQDFEEEKEEEFEIKIPFDPKQVDITVETGTVSKIVERIKHDEIDLFPDFQRNGNLWDNTRMSQLIESILIKLPLPAFYMDVADDDKWIIVDGLQRMSTFKRFMVDQDLKLTNLEFLKDIEGNTYNDLDRVLQRRIDETQITLFKIRKGTPKKLLATLFHRINRRSLKMTDQEIRHILNQGDASIFLRVVAEKEWFRRYIRVSSKRMLDRELFLRFIAFFRKGYEEYEPSLRLFLDEEMIYLNEQSSKEERQVIELAFKNSLERSYQLFGKEMFSKALLDASKRTQINRSLFETTTVNLAKLDKSEFKILLGSKEEFLLAYRNLMKNRTFNMALTEYTNHTRNVKLRHQEVQKLITKYTQHAY